MSKSKKRLAAVFAAMAAVAAIAPPVASAGPGPEGDPKLPMCFPPVVGDILCHID